MSMKRASLMEAIKREGPLAFVVAMAVLMRIEW